MEIGDWLRGLDLSQYEAAFRENSIDFDVLRKLTPEDLKDLGVISVGHRRRLLAAIEELSSAGIATSAVAQSAAAAMVEATAAERRYLTVMFVDLVGSTALAARLDPEDVRDVFAAYHKCCAGVIASNCGFVAKYMGDGVLAYFGYPQAHEQDAENAVRASLAIVAATPKLNTGAAPRCMCGSELRRASWWSAIFLGPERRRSAASSATLRTSRRGCRGSPSPTAWSSPRARESFSAISSSLRI